VSVNQSYWLARTVWVLGEGRSDFRKSDPAFANFLAQRLNLAVEALNWQDLTRYGKYQTVIGVRLPTRMTSDGADASAEAVLGLTASLAAVGSSPARRTLGPLAAGIAAMGCGRLDFLAAGAGAFG
jgi:hypothetical protein